MQHSPSPYEYPLLVLPPPPWAALPPSFPYDKLATECFSLDYKLIGLRESPAAAAWQEGHKRPFPHGRSRAPPSVHFSFLGYVGHSAPRPLAWPWIDSAAPLGVSYTVQIICITKSALHAALAPPGPRHRWPLGAEEGGEGMSCLTLGACSLAMMKCTGTSFPKFTRLISALITHRNFVTKSTTGNRDRIPPPLTSLTNRPSPRPFA